MKGSVGETATELDAKWLENKGPRKERSESCPQSCPQPGSASKLTGSFRCQHHVLASLLAALVTWADRARAAIVRSIVWGQQRSRFSAAVMALDEKTGDGHDHRLFPARHCACHLFNADRPDNVGHRGHLGLEVMSCGRV